MATGLGSVNAYNLVTNTAWKKTPRFHHENNNS